MGMKLNNTQFKMRKETTQYAAPFFKSGSIAKAVSAGDADYGATSTGVVKFPNAVIAGGVAAGWPQSSHDWYLRAALPPVQGVTNLEIDLHVYSAVAQNVTIYWWAIGY